MLQVFFENKTITRNFANSYNYKLFRKDFHESDNFFIKKKIVIIQLNYNLVN